METWNEDGDAGENVLRVINPSHTPKGKDLINHLLPEEDVSEDGTLWRISNKYYSASVKISFDDEDPKSVLLYVGSDLIQYDGTDFLESFDEADVRLIVCETPDSLKAEFSKRIPNSGWELVDLSESPEESSLGGGVGVMRISEALQTAPWVPRLESKNGKLSGFATEEEEMESFEALFSQFADLKSRASSLPPDKRKEYAERVAISFWKAMGGDEEDIAGLSPDGEKEDS